MWLRLRQIALVAVRLPPVEEALVDVLGLEACYRDPGVAHFGLDNVLMPIGNQLLEVVAPKPDKAPNDTAGGRYLTRRGGNGGYMVITQCDDHAPRRARIESLGVRTVLDNDRKTFRNLQLHPKDTGGTFFEIDEQLGDDAHAEDGPWHPAGDDWQRARRTDRVEAITAAEIQCDNPARVAARWAEIAEIPLNDDLTLPLDNATLRFVPCEDGRPEGLGGIDLKARDADAVLAAAERHDARLGDSEIYLCGMRMRLV